MLFLLGRASRLNVCLSQSRRNGRSGQACEDGDDEGDSVQSHGRQSLHPKRRRGRGCPMPLLAVQLPYSSSPSLSSLVFGSGVSVPNKPSASPLMPAVKNRLL